MALNAALVDEFRIRFLNVSSIAEHGSAEVDGWRGRIDWAVKSMLDETGKVAAVVDVGMRQHNGIDGARVKRQIAIAMLGVFAMSLVESAIEEVALAGCLDVVHGPGDGLGRAPECNFHKIERFRTAMRQHAVFR